MGVAPNHPVVMNDETIALKHSETRSRLWDPLFYWLVVSTPLKNIRQWEGLSHILWKKCLKAKNRIGLEAKKATNEPRKDWNSLRFD